MEIVNDELLSVGHQILGSSKVGADTLIGQGVIIGYPVNTSLRRNGAFLPCDGAVVGENSLIRSGTVIYERARLGDEIQTGHGVVIREDACIGSGTVIGSYTTIKDRASLGTGCRLQEAVQVCERAVVGNYVFIGPHVVMTAERYMLGALLARGEMTAEEFEQAEKQYREKPSVVIEDDVRIGGNAVLIAGTHLGRGCMVAAGAVVSTKVPPGCTVAGNPARIIRKPRPEKQELPV